MKKIIIVLVSVLFVALLIIGSLVFPELKDSYNENNTVQTEDKSETASQATDFTVYDADGNAVNLSDFTGKPTVVNFWATWCMYCVEELPDFNKLYKEYKDSVNFIMLDTSDATATAVDFVNENGYSFPVYFDTDGIACSAYSVTGIPMTLFVDAEGNLYHIQQGMTDEATVRSYIEAML